MNGVAIASTLMLGAGRMVVEEWYSDRIAWHSTQVPKKNGDRSRYDAPSNDTRGATDHVRQGTG